MKYLFFLIKKATRVALSQGPLYACKKIYAFITQQIHKGSEEWNDKVYQKWIKDIEPNHFAKTNKVLTSNPKFSVLIPVYNTDPTVLRKCFDSVKQQTYENWEICAVDDNSTKNKEAIETVFKEYKADLGDRFVYKLSKVNQHISLNTNACADLAKGDFFQILDNDDTLSPHAFFEYTQYLHDHPETDILYGDEDFIDMNDKRSNPFFRPDFQPDYLTCAMYFPHFLVKKDLFHKLKGFRKGYEGSQDWDFALRAYAQNAQIGHIPKILYHWRSSDTSTAGMLENKPYVVNAMEKAITSYIEENKIDAQAEKGIWSGSYIMRYKITKNPLVSIIIPNKNNTNLLKTCIKSIYEKSTYKNFEIIIVENGSKDAELFSFYRELEAHQKAKIVRYDKKSFNYSAVNNLGVSSAQGEILLFLNNDVELLDPNSIRHMVEHAMREEIGAVGAKLLYPSNTIQHTGVTFEQNPNGEIIPVHQYAGYAKTSHGGSGAPLNSIRNPHAVTAACLMISRKKFESIGLFDEGYIIAYQDIDLCIKLEQAGFRNLYHPQSVWKHYESITRKTDKIDDHKVKDYEIFQQKNEAFLAQFINR